MFLKSLKPNLAPVYCGATTTHDLKDHLFLEFPALRRPLSRSDINQLTAAQKSAFLLSLAVTLEIFHVLGMAHQDVRLPNFVFDQLFNPLLIDADRSKAAVMAPAPAAAYRNSLMYSKPGCFVAKYNAAAQDWIQFAILLMMLLRNDHEPLDSIATLDKVRFQFLTLIA